MEASDAIETAYEPQDDAARELELLEESKCEECGTIFRCQCAGRQQPY